VSDYEALRNHLLNKHLSAQGTGRTLCHPIEAGPVANPLSVEYQLLLLIGSWVSLKLVRLSGGRPFLRSCKS
jgi:hypothetical protein